MCLLTPNITEYPKSQTRTTSQINTRTIIRQNTTSTSSTSRTPKLHDKITTHICATNQPTKIQIQNFHHKHTTRTSLSTSTIKVRQNRSIENIQQSKKPPMQTPTTCNKDIPTSCTKTQIPGRIPKKFNITKSTYTTNTNTRTHLKTASTKSKTLTKAYETRILFTKNYHPTTTTTPRTENIANIATATINKLPTQRTNLSSPTATPLQDKNHQHHYKQAGKGYGDGLVLENQNLDNDQNRSRIYQSQINNRFTYASCLTSYIDPIQQLLELQLKTKNKSYILTSSTRYNNKWKQQKHRKQSYQHINHSKQSKRYYSKAYQAKKLNSLYCANTKTSNKSINSYIQQSNLSTDIINNRNSNYYSILSDFESEEIIDTNIIEQWDEDKYTNHLYPKITEHNNSHIIEQASDINTSFIITRQDYPISTITNKKPYNPKFTNLLNQIMPRKLTKPSSVLKSLNRSQETTREPINETSSIRSNRSEPTTRNYQSNTKAASGKHDTTEESDDNKSNTSTIQIASKIKSNGTKEKWTEIKKQVNNINTNPLCPNIPNAVPETIMAKPMQGPSPNITPMFTISLMVYIKGPSHWEHPKDKKRKPIFKIRKILLGFLYAAQRVCPDARLCNVHKDESIKDILQIEDIPKTEEDEKSYVFDAQVYRSTFQGQILLKANKEFNDFIRNSDFQNWIQMENIQIKIQPHTGVKFIKVGFFTDVINNLSTDSFHVKTLHQWLASSLPQFELFSDTIYTTHNRKKVSCRVLYVLCQQEDSHEINSRIESISDWIPWTYYESKYFHAFDSELKSKTIKEQFQLHKNTTSYLIPGFLDNDTILMDYSKNTEASNNNNNAHEDLDQLKTKSKDDTMETEDNDNNNSHIEQDNLLQGNNTNINNNQQDHTRSTEHNATIDTNEIEIASDYVGSFMEYYYKNEHEQPIYFQVGPVIDHKREVLVFKKNKLYAEQMNQIIIADLSLHMTHEARNICLDNHTIHKQIQIYKTWKPRHIKKYMATKNIYHITDSSNNHSQQENPNKRQRHEVPEVITTNLPTPQPSEKEIKAAAAEVFADDIIDIVKQTTDKHLVDIQHTHNSTKLDKVEFEEVITAWKTKFENLEETIQSHNKTMETLIQTLTINEIQTTTRFGTVYDTIETKCNEFEGTVLKVTADTSEMYARAQEVNDTKHDELRKDNRNLNEKMDKLLGIFNKKSDKKMKSKQAIETFKEQLTHHTSESMTISKHE